MGSIGPQKSGKVEEGRRREPHVLLVVGMRGHFRPLGLQSPATRNGRRLS
jgi:hypothetical protein